MMGHGGGGRLTNDLIRRVFYPPLENPTLLVGDDAAVAPIEEIQLYVRDSAGARRDVTLIELIEETMGIAITRADLQISQNREGELFITTRQDGNIRLLADD